MLVVCPTAGKESVMFTLPAAAEPLARAVRDAFTQPTFERFCSLMLGLIVTMGRRTVSHTLLLIHHPDKGHWSNYHRIYSRARFSMWKLGLELTKAVVALLPADWPITLVADETVDEKRGKHVWAMGVHYDSRRSSRKHPRLKFGHQWMVVCVLIWLPGIARPWALPILCGLCRDKKLAAKLHLRHKPGSTIARQLLIRMMRWFPDRKFTLLGDSKALGHGLAYFAQMHADRVTLVSRMRSDANLYTPPQPRKNPKARLPKKGKKMPAPREQVQTLPHQQATVAWYGGEQHAVSLVTNTALWYSRHDNQTVQIRWVCVSSDKKKDLEDAYFYCTDPNTDAARIIELYVLRWNIEVTFEEVRALLGLETTRHWCRQSVLRVTPILLGLFSAVTLIWQRLPASKQRCLSETPCYRKQQMSFADALFAVRGQLWETSLLRHRVARRCLSQIPRPLRQTLLWHLSAAA